MEFTLFKELAELSWINLITIGIALLAAVFLIAVLVRQRAQNPSAFAAKKANPTRALVYGALCISLSFVLSYLKLFSLPQGGSITLVSMLPLAFYANRFGVKYGLVAGFAAGLLQFIQKPEVVHWIQPFLDYMFAFACLGLAGLFPNSLPIGMAVGGLGRTICSTISGAVFFGMYAPEGMNPWVYSISYSLFLSIGPDTLLCVIASLLPPVKRLFERI